MRRISCIDQRGQERRDRIVVADLFGGGRVVALASWRIAASMAKAVVTSETWRRQPCQGLVVVEAELVLGRLEAVLDGPST